MPALYPEIEPYAQGMLEVAGGDLVYWEVCGNPRGKPAVVFHGGPGSGCTRWHRRLFNPGVLGAHQFRACRGETLKLVKLAIMDLESSDTLKFAHCSSSCSYIKTLDI